MTGWQRRRGPVAGRYDSSYHQKPIPKKDNKPIYQTMSAIKKAHKDNFMVKNHSSIPSTNIRQRFFKSTSSRENCLILDHRRYICITLTNMMLSSSKVTVDETNRRIVDDKTGNDAALCKFTETWSAAKRMTYALRHTLFPYLPPIPRLMVAIAVSFNVTLSEFFTNIQENNPTSASVCTTVYGTSGGIFNRTASKR